MSVEHWLMNIRKLLKNYLKILINYDQVWDCIFQNDQVQKGELMSPKVQELLKRNQKEHRGEENEKVHWLWIKTKKFYFWNNSIV